MDLGGSLTSEPWTFTILLKKLSSIIKNFQKNFRNFFYANGVLFFQLEKRNSIFLLQWFFAIIVEGRLEIGPIFTEHFIFFWSAHTKLHWKRPWKTFQGSGQTFPFGKVKPQNEPWPFGHLGDPNGQCWLISIGSILHRLKNIRNISIYPQIFRNFSNWRNKVLFYRKISNPKGGYPWPVNFTVEIHQ